MNEIARRDPRQEVVEWLNSERIREQVSRALPDHVPIDWFLRCAQTAVLNNPDLAIADKGTLLRELVAVAQLGLVMDPQMGEAWLIIDRHKKVQRRVGYQGLRKLALQSGLVTALNSQAVYANDVTDIDLGDSPHVHHKINVASEDRGKLLGCYAVARIKGSDAPQVEWMSWKQIGEHRDRYSQAGKSGPWGDPLAEVEMGRKTVFRRLAKWLPKSPLLAEALAHEDRVDMRVVSPDGELPAPEERTSPLAPQIGPQSRQEAAEMPPWDEPVASGPKLAEPATADAAGFERLRRAATSTAALAEDAGAIARRVVSGAALRAEFRMDVPLKDQPEAVARNEAEYDRDVMAEAGIRPAGPEAPFPTEPTTKRRGRPPGSKNKPRDDVREADEKAADDLKDRAMAPDVDEMTLDLIYQDEAFKRLEIRAKDLADEVTACVEQSRRELPPYSEDIEGELYDTPGEAEPAEAPEAEETQQAASDKVYKMISPASGTAFDELPVPEWFDVADDYMDQLAPPMRTSFARSNQFVIEEIKRKHPELEKRWAPLLAEARR